MIVFLQFLEKKMNVHNIMEDIVKSRVDSLYDQIKKEKASWLTCDCPNCRADVVSYVLNRVAPKYVVSGRGVTHNSNLLDDHQLRADINAICLEGIRIISSTKRPFHDIPREECKVSGEKSPVFNFPTFVGSVLDGNTFEPVAGAKILLKMNGKPMEMVDRTWINPATTYKSTNGTYSFWGKAVPAEKDGITKTFGFTVDISAPGYTSTIYNFELPIKSAPQIQEEFNANYSVKIKDIVIFKREFFDEDDNNSSKQEKTEKKVQ